MKQILTIIAFITFFSIPVFTASKVSADSTSCTIIYGGGQACPQAVSFNIKKLIQLPGSTNFTEDDLSINSQKFQPNDKIKFRIQITNTGSQDISDMTVTDTLPQFVNFVSGPGNFNAGTKELTINIDTIAVNQTKTIDFTAQVSDSSLLPQDQGVVCVTNSAKGQTQDGSSAQDSIQFCIEKKVLGAAPTPQVFETPKATSIPTTGPKLLPLLGLLAGGIGGVIIRNRSKSHTPKNN